MFIGNVHEVPQGYVLRPQLFIMYITLRLLVLLSGNNSEGTQLSCDQTNALDKL